MQNRDRTELQEKLQPLGCIEVDDLEPANLTNDIHPLFARERFSEDQLTEAEYEYIRPALQLASKFLTEPAMMDFWNHICHGHLRIKKRHRGVLLDPENHNYYIKSGMKGKDPKAALETTRQKLIELSRNLEIWFADRRESRGMMAHASSIYCLETFNQAQKIWPKIDWRVTRKRGLKRKHRLEALRLDVAPDDDSADEGFIDDGVIDDESIDDDSIDGDFDFNDDESDSTDDKNNPFFSIHEPFGPPQMILHYDFRRHIRDFVAGNKVGKRTTPSQQTQFFFRLAQTLAHETAHCFNWLVYQRPSTLEPQWRLSEKGHFTNEMGESWEMFALGQKTVGFDLGNNSGTTASERPNQELALLTSDWNMYQDAVDHAFVLPIAYASAWFREETWHRIEQKGRLKGRPSLLQARVIYSKDRRLTWTNTGLSIGDMQRRKFKFCRAPWNHFKHHPDAGTDTGDEAEYMRWQKAYNRRRRDSAKERFGDDYDTDEDPDPTDPCEWDGEEDGDDDDELELELKEKDGDAESQTGCSYSNW
jgi:hypothetical protein